MKKIFTLIILVSLACSFGYAQIDTLAKWSFPTGTAADSIPELSTDLNQEMFIFTEGGTSAIDFSKNGLTTKAAQASGWDNGNGIKSWQIKLNTTGYESLKLSSKITSGGNKPGPKEFRVQYRIAENGEWINVPSTTFETANDWTTGVLENITIPNECSDQELIFLRWVMKSDLSTADPEADVLNDGTSKIDDVFIAGTEIEIFTPFEGDTLAYWSFPTGTTADSVPDVSNFNNEESHIFTAGGTSAIDFSKNGFETNAAQASNWVDGEDTKAWQITFNTHDYTNIKLSSKITSGGNKPGPGDFKVQYSIGETLAWIDVPYSTFETANDWTTGILNNIELPVDCEDQELVVIRWVMTSNLSHTGVDVLEDGSSKIDDILVTGQTITGIDNKNSSVINVYPNPSNGVFNIDVNNADEIIIYNISGSIVYQNNTPRSLNRVDISNNNKGIYFISIKSNGSQTIEKIVTK